MKIELLIGALLVAGLAFAPAVAADHEDIEECSAPQDDTLIAQEGLYVTAAGVFEETNGEDGLQSEAGECGNDGHGGPFLTWDADSQLI